MNHYTHTLFRRFYPLIALGFFAILPLPTALALNLNLAWDRNPEPDIAGYRVYQRTAVTTYGQGIDVGNVTATTIPGLSLGNVYYFKITAYNTLGFESAPSNEALYIAVVQTTPTPTPVPTSTPTPTPPTPTPVPTLTPTTPVPSATPTPTASPAIGLVAAYNFDEGSGTTVTDAAGHNLTGTVQGAAWTNGGRYGGGLLFNGTTSYVDLGNPSLLQITGSMTWSAWMKAAGNPNDDANLIAKADNTSGWQLQTSRDTGPRTFGIAVSGGPNQFAERYSSSSRLQGVWYHVAGVYDASARTLDIYINGVQDNGVLSGTVPASQVSPAVNVNIGRCTGGFSFNGIIDEVRIYDRALSQAEIQADMNAPIVTPVTVHDDFNRPDGDLGSNWTIDPTWGIGLTVAGNQVVTSGFGVWSWTANTFAADQYSQVRLSGPIDNWSSVFVRGDLRPDDYYMAVVKPDGAYLYSSYAILRHDLTSWNTGDVLRLEVRTIAPGTARLSLYQNGVALFSYDDTGHFVADGQPGIGLRNSTSGMALDDWEGGELPSGPSGPEAPSSGGSNQLPSEMSPADPIRNTRLLLLNEYVPSPMPR